MSKAGEWAKEQQRINSESCRVSNARPTYRNGPYIKASSGHFAENVTIENTESGVGAGKIVLAPDEAVALAQWILETFGEAQP